MRSVYCTLAVAILTILMLSLTETHQVNGEPSGWMIDVYTQKKPFGGIGLGEPSDSFMPGENVLLFANVTYNQYPVQNVLVSFYVQGPPNSVSNVSFVLSAVGNDVGVAEQSFTIPLPDQNAEEVVFGTWTVNAYIENANDSLTFQVGWVIELASVSVVYEDPPQGGFLSVSLAIQNIAKTPHNATVSLTWFDSENFILGNSIIEDFSIPINGTELTINCTIPMWATPGAATVKALVSRADVVPYSPEMSAAFWISLRGDLNHDNKVDMLDLSFAALAFGSYPGHPRWNPISDVNKDNKVNIVDIALIAKNFGKTWP